MKFESLSPVSAGLPTSNPSTDNVANSVETANDEATEIGTKLRDANFKLAEFERESAVLRSECQTLRSRLDESQQALKQKVYFIIKDGSLQQQMSNFRRF